MDAHRTDTGDQDDRVCFAGGHRHPGPGALCRHHLPELTDLVTGVAQMTRQLTYHLMPGSALPGEKVSTTRVGSPTPARLDVLTLIGPGGRDVRRDARLLVPQVRRWSTVSTYDVTVIRDNKPVTERRKLRHWHSELVMDDNGRPLRVLADDQVGAIPPAEWADEWVRRWRLALQHNRTTLAGRWVDYSEAEQAKRLTRAGIGESVRLAAGRPSLMRAVAAYLDARAAYFAVAAEAHHTARNAVLGLGQATVATDARRRPDAVVAELQLRYGVCHTAATVEVDAHYLTTWLPLVAELDDPDDTLGIGPFTTELRALHKELEYALGYTRDEQWLGRCPAKLVDDRGDPTGRVCGAGLWHDAHQPHVRIQCPRCHSSWPEQDWLALAARIRHAWPVDTRRRYTAGDRKVAERNLERLPVCKGCERTMSVVWKPAPVRGDREPMWRPVRLACPAGCLAGGTQAAA